MKKIFHRKVDTIKKHISRQARPKDDLWSFRLSDEFSFWVPGQIKEDTYHIMNGYALIFL